MIQLDLNFHERKIIYCMDFTQWKEKKKKLCSLVERFYLLQGYADGLDTNYLKF